jgi:hypothetical protein
VYSYAPTGSPEEDEMLALARETATQKYNEILTKQQIANLEAKKTVRNATPYNPTTDALIALGVLLVAYLVNKKL